VVRAHDGVLTTAEARKAGLSRHAVQWALHTQVLRPLRRGVYTTTTLWAQAEPRLQHLLEVLSHQRVNPELVACSTSAAILLCLPTPAGAPAQPQLTAARTTEQRGHGSRGAQGHRGGFVGRRSLLAGPEIWTLDGARVTSPVRTVLDCARHWSGPWGLAAADAAIMKWDVAPAALTSAAASRHPGPGHGRALWVAEHAHARPAVESPLESLARAVVVLAGLPEPTPKVWVRTTLGRFRVDLLDEANGVIVEADGKVKYGSAEDVWREKRREDALRERGFEVVRFTIEDYRQQYAWVAAYRRALARSSRLSAATKPVMRADFGPDHRLERG
jgi:hypothetical protein